MWCCNREILGCSVSWEGVHSLSWKEEREVYTNLLEEVTKSWIEGEIEVVVDLCVLWGITLPSALIWEKIFVVCALLGL